MSPAAVINPDAAGAEGDADAVPKVTKQLEKQVIEEKEEDVEEGESRRHGNKVRVKIHRAF